MDMKETSSKKRGTRRQ